MKNNAICIFVDSVVWDCVGTTRAKVSPTPFLDSLKQEGLVANKLYSHGPYTDAATRSLFTGRNTLDDYGYFFKLNTSPVNHFQLFHDAGYETYNIHYPYYIHDNSLNKNIDHTYYTQGFIFGSEWGGWYKYYHELAKEQSLKELDYLLLGKRMDQMFQCWSRYLKDVLTDTECMRMQKRILESYDFKNAYKILSGEIEKFNQDRNTYIDVFLAQGLDHILAKLDTTSISSYIDPNFLNAYIGKKYKSLLHKIKSNNRKVLLKSGFPSLKRVFHTFKRYLKYKDVNDIYYWVNYLLSLIPLEAMMKRWSNSSWQNGHSARTQYETAIEILKERGNNGKPFYMFFHLGEPHNNIAFFSYDRQEKDIIDEEFEVLTKFVNEVGTDFTGSLVYLLSLRYSDYQIERFCTQLKELNLWDTTSILFISDHGSSYTYYPIHNRRVNNFDDECYHVPMLIRHPHFKPIEINSYQYSKDVFPTFLDVLGIPLSVEFKGRSMLKNKEERQFVTGEFMGPGCPDMTRRAIWFSARDENYIVGYKVGVFDEFDNGELAEVYDLSNDPQGYFNINDSIDKGRIQYLLDGLKMRHSEIREETRAFLNTVSSNI